MNNPPLEVARNWRDFLARLIRETEQKPTIFVELPGSGIFREWPLSRL
jgi:hypothetical protein